MLPLPNKESTKTALKTRLQTTSNPCTLTSSKWPPTRCGSNESACPAAAPPAASSSWAAHPLCWVGTKMFCLFKRFCLFTRRTSKKRVKFFCRAGLENGTKCVNNLWMCEEGRFSRRFLKLGSLRGVQLERIGQKPHGIPARPKVHGTLQVADPASEWR